MKYFRIRDKETLRGFFNSRHTEIIKCALTEDERYLYNLMSNSHKATTYIPELDLNRGGNKSAHHYFKKGFYDAHKIILDRVVQLIDAFELVEKADHEINTKIYYEDDNQILLEL